jgi:hypothetical protein
MFGELFLRYALADASREARRLAEEVRLGREPQAPLANEAMECLFARFSFLRIDDCCVCMAESAHHDHAISL